MSTVTTALFTYPLGDDAALILRTGAIADAYQSLLVANYQRLARWLPGASDQPPTAEQTRADLERRGQAWLAGAQLPVSIALPAERGWQLVGEVNLLVNGLARSAEVGYWLDAAFGGRGLVTRAVTAVLDQAFGPLGLDRVSLNAISTNDRSLRVAQRLGFTREGVIREGGAFPDKRADVVVYGLLKREWRMAAN